MSTTPSDDPGGPGGPGGLAGRHGPDGLPTGYLLEAPPPLGVARRTSPFTVGIELAALIASTLLELVSRRAGQAEPPSTPLDPGLATLPLLVLGPRVLGWWLRTYRLTDTHLELDDGILRRRHRVVPYSRVQQVDLRQSLLAQIFGLAALRIETAGEGGAGAVSLRLLRLHDAASLRRFVLDRRDHQAGRRDAPGADAGEAGPAGAAGVERPPPLAYELARMTPGDLAVSALTQGPGALVGVLLLVGGPWLVASGGPDAPTSVTTRLAVLLVLAVVVVVLRVAGRLLGEWNWTMTVRGDDLQVRAGLLDVREQSVPRRRIQQVALIDNPLRRALGLTALVLHTAVPAGATSEGASPLVQVPLLRRADVPGFLRRVMGPEWAVPELTPRPPAAARRAVVRRLLLLLPGSLGPGLAFGGAAWLTAPLVLAAVPWGRAAHRGAGHAVIPAGKAGKAGMTGVTGVTGGGGIVALASGVVHHRIDLVPIDRIQSARTRTSPLQRRHGLATLRLDIAGATWVGPLTRSPGLYDMDATTAAHLRGTLPS
ncbi:MAG TPA: PH domain-containing protein [Acidimicrobiales bacterium]